MVFFSRPAFVSCANLVYTINCIYTKIYKQIILCSINKCYDFDSTVEIFSKNQGEILRETKNEMCEMNGKRSDGKQCTID